MEYKHKSAAYALNLLFRPHSQSPVYRTVVSFALLVVASSGCSASPERLTWRVELAMPDLESQAQRVELGIREGGCGSNVSRYRSTASFEDAVNGKLPAPPVLGSGRYGVYGVLIDAACNSFATGCVDVQLPLAAGATVTVVLSASARVPVESSDAVCNFSPCDGGTCPNLGDASSSHCKAFGTFQAATNLTAVNSSGDEWDPALSADGLRLYFISSRPGGKGGLDLYMASRSSTSAPFANVTPLVELNTIDDEASPAPFAAELNMVFGRGPVGKPDDLYLTRRDSISSPFGFTALLDTVNTSSDDSGALVTEDGLTLYLTSSRPGGKGGYDLWMSQRGTTSSAFPAPTAMAALNTVSTDGWPSISADGLELYFYSSRSGGQGNEDVYVSKRNSLAEGFTTVSPVSELNTAAGEEDPWISADGTTLIFASDRSGGAGASDLWMATRACVSR